MSSSKLPHAKAVPGGGPPPSLTAADDDDALSSAGLDPASPVQRSPTIDEAQGSSNSGPIKKTASRLSRSNTTKDSRDTKGPARAASPAIQTPAVDPLSQQILIRTNTDHNVPTRLRNAPTHQPDSPTAADAVSGPEPAATRPPAPVTDAPVRDKKKSGASSFLSRLSMAGRRKKDDDTDDAESELGDRRADGTNAPVFSSTAPSASGFIPRHKEPPRYIRVKAHNKKVKEFDRMFLAQQLVGVPPPKPATSTASSDGTTATATPTTTTTGAAGAAVGGRRGAPKTGGAVWAAEFSRDGKYLAAAGRDKVVRVWAVLSTHEERRAHEQDEEELGAAGATGRAGERLSAPVFRSRPAREFMGHTGEVLDLSWSKNNFLLSSSMDKTVRLWHVSRAECLCTFKHKDFVTSISFHPRDDRFFLAGSLDSTLRLWSIPDKSVAFSVQLPDLITAVGFSPDGQTAIAGVLSGLCLFYETHGLKYHTQIHVRSSRGKNAKGSKITGIQTMTLPPGSEDGEVKVLITSNDSRIRVYGLRDKNLEVKYKGHENICSQLHAGFSDDAKYVICGSEDRKAFIWSLGEADAENKDKRPCESFDAHAHRLTVAVFAPTRTRQLLGGSGDPIYDLCNPPPVTLLSREEATATATVAAPGASQTALSEEEGGAHTHHADPAPVARKPEESPGYVARSTHYDGNIIVTADQNGLIKVFRQDCAFVKRRHESWDTGSTFSKKMRATSGAGGGLLVGRSASVLTRTSAGSFSRSRRGSVGTGTGTPVVATAAGNHSASTSTFGSPQLSSDRIMSWRQAVESGRPSSLSGTGAGTPTTARSERSISPSKGVGRNNSIGILGGTSASASAATLASEARRLPYAHAGAPPNAAARTGAAGIKRESVPGSPSGMTAPMQGGGIGLGPAERLAQSREALTQHAGQGVGASQQQQQPPTPSFSFRSLDEDADDATVADALAATTTMTTTTTTSTGTGSFWNLSRWRGITALRSVTPGAGGTPPARSTSEVAGAAAATTAGASRSTKTGEKSPRPKSLGPAVAAGEASLEVENEDDLADEEGGGGRLAVPEGAGARSIGSSRLSSDYTSEDGEEMTCRKCGGRNFKVRKVAGRQRFLCGRCGKMAEEEPKA